MNVLHDRHTSKFNLLNSANTFHLGLVAHQHHKVRCRVHKKLQQTRTASRWIVLIVLVSGQTERAVVYGKLPNFDRGRGGVGEKKSLCGFPLHLFSMTCGNEKSEFGRVSYFLCECKLNHQKKTHHTHESDGRRDNRLFLHPLLVIWRVYHG